MTGSTRFLCLMFLALLPQSGESQVVRGTVIEEGSEHPISAARISLVGHSDIVHITSSSDERGNFVVRLNRSGPYVLQVSHPSYVPLRTDTIQVSTGETVIVELRLATDALAIQPLLVTARLDRRLMGFRERSARHAGTGTIVTREDIDRRPHVRPSELFRDASSAELVPVTPCLGCLDGYLIYIRRGGGRCLATVLIDGLVVQQSSSQSIDTVINADMLEGAELYSSPATVPAELAHAVRGDCGIVAFWTRERSGGNRWNWIRFVAGGAAFALLVLLVR